jgi:hypothetical protein
MADNPKSIILSILPDIVTKIQPQIYLEDKVQHIMISKSWED